MSRGGGSASKRQHKYNLAQWEHQWDQMNVAHEYREDQYEMQVRNAAATTAVQNEQAYNDWADTRRMQIFDYNNQRQAHNASLIARDRQIEMNQLAEELALNDNRRVYNDKMTQIGFQNEELLLGHTQKVETHGLRVEELEGQRGISQRQGDLKRAGLDLDVDTAAAAGNIQKLGTAQGLRSASEVAGLNARGLILELGKINSEVNQKSQTAMLENLRATGSVMASGQTGRSSRKAMQAANATYGQSQAMLADLMLRSTDQHGLNFDRISQTLSDTRAKGEIDYTRISNDIVTAGRKADLGRVGIDIEQSAADLTLDIGTRSSELGVRHSAMGTQLGQRQLQASADSADAEFDAQKLRISTLDRRNADIQAQGMVTPEPVLPPEATPPVEIEAPEIMEPPPIPTREAYNETRPVKGGGGGGGGFGMFMQIAGMAIGMASDDRLKRSYNRVGTSPSGVPVYTFNYIHDGDHGPTYMGTSAQDLIKMGRKDAVGQREKDGFYYVDYSKLDVEFEQIS